MALSVNYLTKVISVPQSDLTLVSGTIYKMDTEGYFRAQLMDLWDDEDRIWLDDAFRHNTQVAVAGVTYARVIEIFNGFSVEFTPNSQWTVILEGSNNNVFDVENGILVQNQVQVIPTNSAGLIVNQSQAISDQDKNDIADKVWDENTADHQTAGTTGKQLTDIPLDNDLSITDKDDIADRVWDESLATHQTAGTAGKKLDDIDDTAIPTVPTKEQIADQVWDESLAGHTGVGSAGEKLDATTEVSDLPVPPTVDQIADQVWDETTASHVNVGSMGKQLGDIDTATIPTPPTSNEIADQVWDEQLAGHETVGSMGEQLSDTAKKTDIPTPPTVGQIADGVWDENLTGHQTAGTAGKQLSDIDITPIPTPPTVFEISDQVWQEILADHSAVVGSVAEKIASLNNDTTPADIASIADAVWNEDLSTYLTYGTAGNRLHLTGHINKAIFINTENPVNGDGTAGSPYNNINDAKDSAEQHGIREIVTYSELILTSSFKNFIVRGLAAPSVDTNGQDVSGSEFYHCTMKGTYVALKQIVAQECALTDGFQLTGYFENCVITGTMNVIGGAVIKNCASGVAGLDTPIFNMNTGVATSLSVRDYSGGILITNMDHINDVCTIEMAQGRAFLDNTNVAGLASFRGVSFFEDTSAGTTVDTSALLDPSKSQMTEEEQIQLFDALTRNQFIGLSD